MKIYKSNEIKNIALLGSKGSGKTTLAESMIYECGVIKRRGTVDAGNTVSDYFPVEKEYGYSVFSTVFNAEFNGKKLNIIDCPGSDDFVGNAYTALGVCDMGLILVDAEYGVEVGTQNIFRTTAELKKPVIFALNQMDGEKADFENVMEQMREDFGPRVVQIQYPLESGPNFHSMIDVLLMKKYEWGPDGGVPTISDIPEEELEKARELNQKLVEAAAENDETLMEKFFEQGSLTEDEMREGIRKGLVDRSIYPVVVLSAAKDMGVRRLMEFLGNVCPFVTDMPAPVDTAGEEVKPLADGPVSVFFFKTSVEPHIGEVSYFKVMSGTLKAGMDLDNVSRGSKERLAQIFTICGQLRAPIDSLEAGDIGAAVKLKDVRTGNTLNEKGCEYQFDFIKYPAPKYVRAIRPVNESDAEKLAGLLTRMHEEDPTWIVEQSKELKQTLVKGQGEFHLRTLKWRIENNDKLPVEYQEQRIPYRETITKAARADYRHKKQSGGHGQYGDVIMEFEPSGDLSKPYEFEEKIFGGAVPRNYFPAVEKGLQECVKAGPLAGYPVVGVKATLIDGSYHPVDSSEMAFKMATMLAFKNGFMEASPVLLEPIAMLTVTAPDRYSGDIMGDLNKRRGRILNMTPEDGKQIIEAEVPMLELYGYSTSLRSITGGSGDFEYVVSRYEQAPPDVQAAQIKND